MPEIAGRQVGGVGFGMISLLAPPSPPSQDQAIATLRNAVLSGCTLWNGGEIYGTPDYNSLTILNRYFEKYPEDAAKVVLNIKGACEPDRSPNGNPDFVKQSVANCLAHLGGRAKIDMFEPARRDMNVPLELTLDTLAELVEQGKIGGVALSEVNAETIKQAAKITKIVAVEIELSLWQTDPLENGIADACAHLGIPIIAYSPLGRGALSGNLSTAEQLDEKDFRRIFPRFQPGNLEKNLELVKALQEFAKKKACTPSQLALGWLLALSNKPGMPEIIPIPSTSNPARVLENAQPTRLSAEDMEQIDVILSRFEVVGNRYPDTFMKFTDL